MPVAQEEDWHRLIVASQAGNATAHRQLLTELAPYLRAFFLRRTRDMHTSEDLVQETLIAVHRRRDSFDPAQPLLRWVHAIALYRLSDHFRKQKHRQHGELDDQHPDATNQGEAVDSRLSLEAGFATLSNRDAQLIRSTRIEGQSVRDAADLAGISEAAAKVAIHRALKRLSDFFKASR